MALQDFIKKLKEQDDSDVVYSKEPERSIQIIPPEKTNQSITLEQQPKTTMKIIPPSSDEEKPKIIKFKFNVGNSSKVVETEVRNIEKPKLQTIEQKPKLEKPKLQTPTEEQREQTIQQVEQVIAQPTSQSSQKPTKMTDEEIAEELFKKSGTAISKRATWFDYYEKAKTSRKKNSIVDRMKQGKFAITFDNQVLILPDHDIQHKSSSQLLGEKWLQNY